MQQLPNLSAIDTNRIEGRLLIAAIAIITGTYERSKSPDEVLNECHTLAEKIYKDAGDVPPIIVRGNFQHELTNLINIHSMEEKCGDVPDWVISEYLVGCMENIKGLMNSRDVFFNIDVWEKIKK